MRPRGWWGLVGVAGVIAVLWQMHRPGAPVDAAVPSASLPSMGMLVPRETEGEGAPTAPVASETQTADEVELCGGQWVKIGADGHVDADDFKRVAHVPELRAQMLAALRADTSEFARAAAIRLGPLAIAPPALEDGVACEPAVCEAQRRYVAQVDDARETLARVATTTREPQVYALAFDACGGGTVSGGTCGLLSAAQWARLDPGNAVPWLSVLAEAGRRRDAAAQQEALYRIATSTRSDMHYLALTGQVLAHTPDDDAAKPAAQALMFETIGIEVAQPSPGFQYLVRSCRGAALDDANRRQVCGAVAELLFEHGDTLMARGIGARIGEQLGWPTERIERWRGESGAYTAWLTGPGMFTQTGNCAGLQRDLSQMARTAQIGETGAMREWGEQAGYTADDFMRYERDTRAAEAASTASAAAPASAPVP